MSNITSYIKWRGDLTFDERPFCDVDNIVLSELSYFYFDGIVPKLGKEDSILVKDALDKFLKMESKTSGVKENRLEFANAVMNSKRFGGLSLRNYTNSYHLEGSQTDFVAMEIRLSEDTAYIAFRGTNGSLRRWREDFYMCYQNVPSQRFAVKYVKDIYDEKIEHYYFGGHAKGGNLALYAAASCGEEQQKKIVKIYNNDGAGLSEDVLESEKIDAVRNRLVRIVPEFSLIGDLFRTDASTIIVKSDARKIKQHDMLTWKIEGENFITCEEHSKESVFYNDVIHTWVESADMDQRDAFITHLFNKIETGNMRNLADLSDGEVEDFLVLLLSVTQEGKRTGNVLQDFGNLLSSRLEHVQLDSLLQSKETIQAILFFVAGVVAMMYPDYAVTFAGLATGLSAAIYMGARLLDTAFHGTGTLDGRKMKMVIQMIAMCLLMYLVADRTILLQLSDLFVSMIFFVFAYYWLTKAFRYKKFWPKKFFGFCLSAVFFLVGVLPLFLRSLSMHDYMIAAGCVLGFYGLCAIIYCAYENGKKHQYQ